MPIIKRCGDCGADITADPLTHDCPARRARLALVQPRAAWAVTMLIAGGTAIYAARMGESWTSGALSMLCIIAAWKVILAAGESRIITGWRNDKH